VALHDDDRTRLARAYHRATQVATIAIGMVIPPIVGHFADEKWGTKVLFTILGAVLGLAYGIWHLMKLAGSANNQRPPGADHEPN
jgi:F0F1-type ATP synthase assembly protein I